MEERRKERLVRAGKRREDGKFLAFANIATGNFGTLLNESVSRDV